MTVTSYKSTEPIYKAPTIPYWSITLPSAHQSCSSVLCYSSARTPQQPGDVVGGTYEPEKVVAWKSGSRSGRRIGTPPYRYTSYENQKEITRQYLIRTHKGCNGLNLYRQSGYIDYIGGGCKTVQQSQWCTGPIYSLYDTVSRNFAYTATQIKSELQMGEIQTMESDIRSELFQRASTSYDILTDIAEMREVPRLLQSVNGDLLSIMDRLLRRHGRDVLKRSYRLRPKHLLRSFDKKLRKFGEEWMQYRYGVMPLVYSYQDVRKTLRRGASVTDKMCKTLTPVVVDSSPPATDYYWVLETKGDITVRGSMFQHFTSDEVSMISGLGVNPLVTAWELIPYSFVMDWFIGVGDYIASRTCQSYATQKWACLSRRSKYTTYKYLHKPNEDFQVSITDVLPSAWFAGTPPSTPNQVIQNPEGLYIFEEKEVDSYVRWDIPLSGAPLRINPSLNWRRMLDSGVMSLNLLRSVIRSYKNR